jgi:hypothetical protein
MILPSLPSQGTSKPSLDSSQVAARRVWLDSVEELSASALRGN